MRYFILIECLARLLENVIGEKKQLNIDHKLIPIQMQSQETSGKR